MKNLKLGFQDFKPLLEKLFSLLKENFGDSLLSFAVFGSMVREKVKPLSDIDILIIYKRKDFDPIEKFISILMKLRHDKRYIDLQKKGFLGEPSPVFLSKEELKRHPWILLDLIDESIIFYDNEDILKNTLKIVKERLTTLRAKRYRLSQGRWFWDLKPDWKPGEVVEL